MPRYDFTADQILRAAQVDALSDQTVMTFGGTAARGSAIPSPVEGMVTYLEDQDRLEVYTNAWKPVGTILQVASTTKTDTFSTTSTSFADITGLSLTITPSSTASKILLVAAVSGHQAGNETYIRFTGGNSTNYVGDAAGSRTRAGAVVNPANGARQVLSTISYLDSPSTVSAVTYKVQAMVISGGTFYLNRSATDTDNNQYARTPTSFTVMEVAG